MRRAADRIFLLQRRKIGARYHQLPDLPGYTRENRFRQTVGQQSPVGQDRDVGGDRFHIRHDVRRQNHDALAGKFREQIPEAHAFFRIEPRGRLIDDQELRIVE
jgi:hypothetical protein